nr:hypothetical protein [Tanacetum cinerariifolium]
MPVIDNEETLILEEDLRKRFVPQQELSADEAFWYHMLNASTKSSVALPVKIEAPKELPKVSLVNESLKKLKLQFFNFDKVVKIRTTPNAQTERDWGFEHTKAIFKNEIIPFLKSLKDIFNVFDTDLLNEIMEVQIVFDQMDAAVQQSSVENNGIVEQAKAKQPLEKNELLIYVQDTCPNAIKHNEKKVAVTQKNKQKPKNVKNVGSSKKAKIVESKNANHSEPNHTWGSNTTDIPSSSSLIMTGLVPNTILQQPCIPLNRDGWDHLFQPMFDEYFNPPTISVSLVPVAAAPRAVDLADSPVSTSIDQDAPSTSIPSTHDQEHSLIISQGFEQSPKSPHFHDDPLLESLHEDSTSQGSSSNVRSIHTLFESLGRWTKDHPIANVNDDPSRSVSTRKQIQTDAMWCYFNAFITSVEPKNFKQALTKLSWIDAMQ